MVEGAKTDVMLMRNLLNLYGIDAKYEIVSYNTSIHTLYQQMFSEGMEDAHNLDILQVLKSRENVEEKRKLFDENFTDILLIFDLDPHDPMFDATHIQLMQNYFHESTDMGKLYLNYPMVEAFYHIKTIPDLEFPQRRATLAELNAKTYKKRVHHEAKFKDYRKFFTTKENSNIIILQNLAKALSLTDGRDYPEQELLKHTVDFSRLVEEQLACLLKEDNVHVLCTCALYLIDYNPNIFTAK